MAKVLFPLVCVAFCCIFSTFGFPSQYLNNSYRIFRTGPNDVQQTGNETVTVPTETTPAATYIRPNVCECSDIYDPVCGSNGKSYSNPCQMDCELGPNTDVTVTHQGNCIPF